MRRSHWLARRGDWSCAGATSWRPRQAPSRAGTSYVGATEQRIARELGGGDRVSRRWTSGRCRGQRPRSVGRRRRDRAVNAGDAQERANRGAGSDGASLARRRADPRRAARRADEPLQSGAAAGQQQDVLQSRVLERQPDRLKVFLRLQRIEVRDGRLQHRTRRDVSAARPDARVEHQHGHENRRARGPGHSAERELRPGHDRGFLWRWNSYWRYEQVPGGVIAECESISLSRSVPSVVSFVAGPLIRSTARESMERTLASLRTRFGQRR